MKNQLPRKMSSDKERREISASIGKIILSVGRFPEDKVYISCMAPYNSLRFEAMLFIDNINDKYIFEDGRTVVTYFLGNANSWRGETARAVKAELKSRLKR
jgi:hypothetical protein